MTAAALPNLIGLAAFGRAGKDTVGAMLGEHGYRSFALADALRDDLLRLDPIVYSNVRLSTMVERDGWDDVKFDGEVRRLLQTYGTEVARAGFGNGCWLLRLFAGGLEAHLSAGGRAVVTDLRFDNEAKAIRARGGVVVRINGRGGLDGTAASHASEQGVSTALVDHTLVNDGTLDELAAKVADLLAGVRYDFEKGRILL